MKKIKTQSSFSRLIEFARPYRGKLILSVFFAILGVACTVAPYFATANIIIKLLSGEKKINIYLLWCGIAATGFLMRIIFISSSTTISHTATYSILKEIRIRLTDKLSRVPMGYILETSSGKLENIMVDRVESLETTLAHLIPELTSNILCPAAIIIYLFFLDWRMALATLITLPIGFLCMKGMSINYSKRFSELVNKDKKMNSAVIEYINGIEVIKAFNQSAKSYEKYSDAVSGKASYAVNWMKDCEIYKSMGISIWPSVLVSVLPLGCFFTMNGTLSSSVFVTVIILSMSIVKPIIKAMGFTDSIASAGTIINEVCKILDKPELIRHQKYADQKDLNISLKNVTFSYYCSGSNNKI